MIRVMNILTATFLVLSSISPQAHAFVVKVPKSEADCESNRHDCRDHHRDSDGYPADGATCDAIAKNCKVLVKTRGSALVSPPPIPKTPTVDSHLGSGSSFKVSPIKNQGGQK